MSMTILEAMSLPDEFIGNHCGLCGNSGYIDTVGKIFTAAGVGCGIKTYCLCANGRAIKHQLDPPKRTKPPQTFWVGWDDYSWRDPKRLGPKMIAAWSSGQSGDGKYSTMVAWVVASTVAEVIAAVDRDYPCKGERRWRFINPLKRGDFKRGDRFPLNSRAQKIITKLKAAK